MNSIRGARRRTWTWRAVMMALALAPLVALGVSSRAEDAPADADYPHGRFEGECGQCHDAERWTPVRPGSRFDHAKTGFPLEGAHAAADCRGCHESLDFSQSRRLCVACHEDPHRGEVGLDCSRCHAASSFLDRSVMRRMHQLTGFPLGGGHAGLDCESCHAPAAAGQMRFVGARADCAACHRDLAAAVRDPDHAGFPADCALCHSPLGWNAARVDHSRTRFPLTGAHTTLACAACHGDGVYRGRSIECISCHQADYDGTTDPDHATAGFATDCRQCHNTTTFDGARFDHAGTAFPLTGAHTTQACAACHGGGIYRGLGADCVSCHRADYDGATDPNHVAAGFPTECRSCHNTTTWDGARFDHDASWFPIYSGRHAGRWSDCATCHTVASSYSTFSCFGCHPHDDRQETDGHHDNVTGYQYESRACYTCHPRGEE